MTESPELARRYAQLERSLEPQKQLSVARGPIGLIAVLAVLCASVAAVVAVDLRRLQTPEGTALAWTGATVFGDCAAFERLSVPDRVRDTRTREERCAALQAKTEPARAESSRYAIDLLDLERGEGEAVARMRVVRPDGERLIDLPLRLQDGRWRVVRTGTACRLVRCP